MIKISAVVITYNEEKNISRCLDSLLPVVDEIIVVDSFSDDATLSISLAKGARVLKNKFEGYIEQKNFGIENALYDYILSIDADEYLSERLTQSILAIKSTATSEAFIMNRLSSYGSKWINHTDWYPDKKLRLWNRKFGRWGGPNPHEKVILNSSVEIKHIKGDLLHVAYKDADQLLLKANQYSSLFARNARMKVGSNYFKIFYKTLYTFIRNYFIRTGFLSGLAGLQISFTNATYSFFKFSKLLELNRSLPSFPEEVSYIPNGISVVIPNYNGEKLFPRTLGPLLSVMKQAGLPFEIFIVDDCSTDNSIAYLKENFPEIIILKNEVNKGFSGTINKGIFSTQYELVLLLNSDIILTDGYFEHQLKYFNDKDTFGVMGRVIGWRDDKIQDGARLPEFSGFKMKTSGNYLLKEMQTESLYTLYLSGANALVSRAKLIELGGFDEIFSPFYIEDCDLSFRAWRVGWKCYYENRAICRHKTSSSVKAKNRKEYVEVIYNRNKLFLHAIHMEGYLLPFWFLQVSLEAFVRVFTFRLSFVKSLVLFLKEKNEWISSRKKYDQLRNSRGESVSLFRISRGIQQSLYKRKKVKFLSVRSE